MGGCDSLEITDFQQFLYTECVVLLKELIFNSFLVWDGLVVFKDGIFRSSTLEGCGGLERTVFNSFHLGGFGEIQWTGFFNSLYIGRV